MAKAVKDLGLTCETVAYREGAKQMIEKGKYDCILLDHQMPETPEGKIEDIGYGLIPFIRIQLPDAVIIGTSTLSVEEIESQGWTMPDHMMEKGAVRKDLPKILKL